VNQTPGTYRLSARTTGTVILGLQAQQLAILATGTLTAILVTVRAASSIGMLAGASIAATAALLAFVPWRGRPLFEAIAPVVRYATRRVRGQHQWLAPIPFVAPSADVTRRAVPRCLRGLEIVTVEHAANGRTDNGGPPDGYIRDRTCGTLTAVLAVRGREFALLDTDEQHQRIAQWGRVLGQFARDTFPIVRICWYEHCTTGTVPIATPTAVESAPAHSYRALLQQATPSVAHHELTVTITVAEKRFDAHGDHSLNDAVQDAGRLLRNRLRDAGLEAEPTLAPSSILDLIGRHADPYTVRPHTRSFASHFGYTDSADALPLALETQWDCLRVDQAWHRSFWISAWPTLDVGARWLEPLLLDGCTTRTVALIMEPISMSRSRRRLNVDAVRLQGDVANRERHGLRVPFHLERAHEDLDRRERELQSGYAEYRYLALLTVTANERGALETATRTVVDNAAQCGLELRALDLRHDVAWACTLPIGRTPDRGITAGLLT
jgi:hypothetical protein